MIGSNQPCSREPAPALLPVLWDQDMQPETEQTNLQRLYKKSKDMINAADEHVRGDLIR